MTGFGRAIHTCGGLRYTVEITSVNRKGSDIAINLPRSLTACEIPLRELAARSVSRGRVTISVTCSRTEATGDLLDEDLLHRIHTRLDRLRRKLGLASPPGLAEIIPLYLAAAREPAEAVPASSGWRDLQPAVAAALRALDEMRRTEGAHLRADLSARLDRLERHLHAAAKLAPAAVQRHRRQLRARLEKIEPAFATTDDRLARELALFAERADISEEITRLQSHLGQFRRHLAGKTAAGRTLDFLSQEMFREWNTLGAKANCARIARQVVAAKTELERVREQVQNVE